MSYTHLTEQERDCIYQCQGMVHQALLAHRLKRHPATIRRELNRFRRNPDWPYYHYYLPDSAHRFAQARRRQKLGIRWLKHRPLLAYVKRGLRAKWSPEQISGRLVVHFPDDPRMRVSHTSIYRWVKAERRAGGKLWQQLRQSSRKWRRPYGSGERAIEVAGVRSATR